jgi:hypothetical protein
MMYAYVFIWRTLPVVCALRVVPMCFVLLNPLMYDQGNEMGGWRHIGRLLLVLWEVME